MKLVIQRVKEARVTTKDTDRETVIGEITSGFFVLIGITHSDTENIAQKLAEKLLNLRIMDQEKGKMDLSILDTKGEILVVSQFTLYADTKGGRRPSFIDAADPEYARKIYDYFIEKLRASGLKIETGSFGNYMEIESVADGPVTLVLES